MSGGFTRVTVVGPRVRVHLALSQAAPVALLLPQVLRYAGGPPGPRAAAWQLSRLDGTVLPAGITLAEAGITDGDVLLLVDDPEPAPPPRVTDVVEATENTTAARAGAWSRSHTHTATRIVLLGTAVLIAGLLSSAGTPAPTALLTCAFPAAGLLAVFAARRTQPDSPWWLAAALPLLACATDAGLRAVPDAVADQGWRLAIAVAAVLGGALIGLAMSRQVIALALGVTAAALPLIAVGVASGSGLRSEASWGAVALLCLLVLGVFPRLAVDASGLATLEDAVGEGQVVPMSVVVDATTRAARYATAALWGTVVPAGAALVVLGVAERPVVRAYAAVLAVAFLLRARAFSLVPQFLPPVTVGLIGASVLLAGLLESSPSWLPPVVAVMVISVLAAAVLWRPGLIAARRISRWLNRFEGVAVAVCPVLLVAVGGLYEFVAAHTFLK